MNALHEIMSVQEASILWNLSPIRIQRLCQNGDVKCRKIGKTWVLLKEQPKPICA